MKLQVRLLKSLVMSVWLMIKWLNSCWILSKATEEVPLKALLVKYRITLIPECDRVFDSHRMFEMKDEER